MDVWKSRFVGRPPVYSESEPEPLFGIVTERIKMHREVYENLSEFEGF